MLALADHTFEADVQVWQTSCLGISTYWRQEPLGVGFPDFMAELVVNLRVSAEVVEYRSHTYCESIVSSEPEIVSAAGNVLHVGEGSILLHIDTHSSNDFTEAKLFGVRSVNVE